MKRLITKASVCLMLLTIPHEVSFADSPKAAPPKRAIARSVYYNVPSGYNQVGNTDIYYRQSSSSVDVMGKFGEQYYSSTYSDVGYKLAMKVGEGYATNIDCLNGTTVGGINCTVSIAPQGELARIIYTVTNTTEKDTTVSLGTHADVMIGSNDSAPISRRKDTIGNTYGLTMKDGNGAELCVLFGSGLVGVNSVSDFWFGYYYLNSDANNMVGNYSSGENYMEENGHYDSGMGWCWKDRTVPANNSVEFSYLIGVGDVNLEPNSSFEVTPDDPDGWNDLSRPHRLTLEGEYESPAGQNGKIQYAVEDSEEWLDLTEEIESGSSFTASLVAMFDANKETHTIRFRTMDAVGNTAMLTPIIYKDVSYHPITGIEEKVFNWGDSIYQTNLMCDLPTDQYSIADYHNNVNAGVAAFNIEGVFPYSIGRKTYNFTIKPLPLGGQLLLEQESFVYDGSQHCPGWTFTNDIFNTLDADNDYSILWSNNVVPGTAELRIKGKGNFSNELSANFFIDKAQLNSNLYTVTLPKEDVTFDDTSHGASVSVSEGVGTPTIYYSPSGDESPSATAPKDNGKYDIYLEFADGELYYGKAKEKIFTFTIYQFDETDWEAIQAICPALTARGWSTPWDLSGGISTASHLTGLTIEQGKVVGLDLSNASLSGMFPVELLSLSHLRSLNLSGNSFEGAVESVAAYMQQNPAAGANLTELNIANNSLSGNLGIMAACFPNITSIDARGNCLSDIYPMISEKVINLNVSGQTIDRTVEYNLSNTSIEELAQQIPTILLYDHAAQSYTKPLSLQCSMEDGFGMTLSYINGHIAISDVSEQNAYHGESGDVIDVMALSGDTSEANSTLKLKLLFEEGDANFNGNIDILDLQSTISFMFEEYHNKPFNFTAANLWKDESINVQDAVCLVNKIIETQPTTYVSAQRNKVMSRDGSDNYEAAVIIENGELKLQTTVPVASFDITINNCSSIALESLKNSYGLDFKVKQSGSNVRVIAYSLSGLTIPVGILSLGKVDGEDGTISHVMLSDSEANEIKATTSKGMLSGISATAINDNIEITRNGVRVNNVNDKTVQCGIYNIHGECLHSITKTNSDSVFIEFDFSMHTPYIVSVNINGTSILTKKILLTK